MKRSERSSLPSPSGESLTRPQMTAILRAALEIDAPMQGRTSAKAVPPSPGSPVLARFTKQAALAWLAHFPGDLPVSLAYAQTLLHNGRARQALPILEAVVLADPEYSEALDALHTARNAEPNLPVVEPTPADCLYALGRDMDSGYLPPKWAKHVRTARIALVQGDVEAAEAAIHQALLAGPPSPLLAVTHLRVHARLGLPSLAARDLADHYRSQWPACQVPLLVLADALLESGEEEKAVGLLHLASASDVTGQVAERLWGRDHPYRAIWPARLAAPLDLAVPAEISAVLGWNRLPAPGEANAAQAGAPNLFELPLAGISEGESPAGTSSNQEPGKKNGLNGKLPQKEEVLVLPVSPAAPPNPSAVPPTPAGQNQSEANSKSALPIEKESLLSIQAELERIAASLKKKYLASADGRFPVYVLFTTRTGLSGQYGAQLPAIEGAMQRVVGTIGARPDWNAILVYADDAACMAAHGLQPANPNDPTSLKGALASLDTALGKRGEMIGAVLIVGGPEVVPFHSLPNPVDDSDEVVPSDNPYATRDEDTFIPEWLVGRLPGGIAPKKSAAPPTNPGFGKAFTVEPSDLFSPLIPHAGERYSGSQTAPAVTTATPAPAVPVAPGPETAPADMLIRTLEGIAERHARRGGQPSWVRSLFQRVLALLFPRQARLKISSWGYSAAVWRQAAAEVYAVIGENASLWVSPPFQAGNIPGRFAPSGAVPAARLGYFNLHGVAEAGEWYGQRDPAAPSTGAPDYPVALRPADIGAATSPEAGSDPGARSVPQVVYTEACYGAHIQGKAVDDALALRFLAAGAQAFVGSTCITYGSVAPPLITADLLGAAFWRLLQEGLTAGEAFRRAKIHLAREMNRRQGFLDGEDQKTLLSFVLLGDPLALVEDTPVPVAPKQVYHRIRPRAAIKMVCEGGACRVEPVAGECQDEPANQEGDPGARAANSTNGESLSPETLASVRQLVDQYLPGMRDARLSVSQEHPACQKSGQACQACSGHCTHEMEQTPGRRVVTFSKQVQYGQNGGNGAKEGLPRPLHAHYARVTLDAQGKVVKVAVSR